MPTRRRDARRTSSASATASENWATSPMSNLFDLPFEEEPDEEPVAEPVQPAPAVRRVLSVTELTVRVRDALEQQIGEIWVEGELSNCRVWNTGHLYFTLKDA